MPRIADRDRDYFSNPIKNLADLFFYIQKTLDCTCVRRKKGFSLSTSSLSVDFTRKIEGLNINEQVRIRKKWRDFSEERIGYGSNYLEQKACEQIERVRMRSGPESDRAYRENFEIAGVNRVLSKEIYADSLVILQLPQCTLEYQTNNLGRGLRTLASLNIPLNNEAKVKKENVIAHLFLEMVRTVDWLLASQLGRDRKEWKRLLRKGKADIVMPFKKRFENACPPWIVGYDLVDICKIFTGKRLVRN